MSGNKIKQKLSTDDSCKNCYDTSDEDDYNLDENFALDSVVEIIGNKIKQKLSKTFYCEKCDYNTDRKSNLINHFGSVKHQKELDGTKIKQKTYFCNNCNKSYQTSAGLWKHKNKNTCNEETNDNETNTKETSDKELIMMLIKENSEMKSMMMEVIKNGTHNTSNSHNKTFNLQFFLNEQCKDALNINDFIDSIQLQVKDLEETGKLGYVDGISKVVIENLNSLNVHKRPIHCSDSKREVIYIKDDKQWSKDNDNKDKMKNVIRKVANKNMKQIPEWVKTHPECFDSESKQNDKYLKIVSNSMSGSTEQEQKNNMDKIISKVAKEITINK